MRKEVFLAVFIGLALGLIITYGVYTARSSKQVATVTPTPSASAGTTTTQDTTDLIVTNPRDESLQKDKNVTVTGTTWPRAFVVIFTNDKETITTADGEGSFSITTEIKSGSNVLTAYAINEDGKKVSVERTVTLALDATTAEPTATASATAKPKATAIPKASATPRPSTTP